jgi:hypothetical protein
MAHGENPLAHIRNDAPSRKPVMNKFSHCMTHSSMNSVTSTLLKKQLTNALPKMAKNVNSTINPEAANVVLATA